MEKGISNIMNISEVISELEKITQPYQLGLVITLLARVLRRWT
jgi:hypothetical protein